MKNQRILAFNQSRQLSAAELEKVSAAGTCTQLTAGGTYGPGGADASVEIIVDC